MQQLMTRPIVGLLVQLQPIHFLPALDHRSDPKPNIIPRESFSEEGLTTGDPDHEELYCIIDRQQRPQGMKRTRLHCMFTV